MPEGPRQGQKIVRDVSKGGGAAPEERPYDVSRGQKSLCNASPRHQKHESLCLMFFYS